LRVTTTSGLLRFGIIDALGIRRGDRAWRKPVTFTFSAR